jgi:hypothetical protein
MLVTQSSKFSHQILLGLAILCWGIFASFFVADYLFFHDIRMQSPSAKPTPRELEFSILFLILILFDGLLCLIVLIFSLPRPLSKGFSTLSLASSLISGSYVLILLGMFLFGALN